MNRSRYKSRYLKCSSREKFLAYKKAENLCSSLNKKTKRSYFEKATENGIMGSKKFWSRVKPFLSSKGFIHNDNISIEIDNKIIEEKECNSHYLNIQRNLDVTLASKGSKKVIFAAVIDKVNNKL